MHKMAVDLAIQMDLMKKEAEQKDLKRYHLMALNLVANARTKMKLLMEVQKDLNLVSMMDWLTAQVL
jgi:hypothetical protein